MSSWQLRKCQRGSVHPCISSVSWCILSSEKETWGHWICPYQLWECIYISGSPSESIHVVGRRRFLHPGYRNASSGMKTLVINVNSSFKVQIQENCKIDWNIRLRFSSATWSCGMQSKNTSVWFILQTLVVVFTRAFLFSLLLASERAC